MLLRRFRETASASLDSRTGDRAGIRESCLLTCRSALDLISPIPRAIRESVPRIRRTRSTARSTPQAIYGARFAPRDLQHTIRPERSATHEPPRSAPRDPRPHTIRHTRSAEPSRDETRRHDRLLVTATCRAATCPPLDRRRRSDRDRLDRVRPLSPRPLFASHRALAIAITLLPTSPGTSTRSWGLTRFVRKRARGERSLRR